MEIPENRNDAGFRLWRVTPAAAVTPLAAGLMMLALALLAEACARSERAADWLPPGSYGTASRVLDVQIERFLALERTAGVDCVFLGSSPVQDGFDPAGFSDRFEELRGWRPDCYNLAVPGMRATSVGILGRWVFATADPWLVVYGFSPRDFNRAASGPGLDGSTWLRHRDGAWSVRGWLIDRSSAFRRFLGMSTKFQILEGYKRARLSMHHADGFLAMPRQLGDPEEAVARLREALTPMMRAGPPEPEAIDQLAGWIDAADAPGEVALVRMPIHRGLARVFSEESSFDENAWREVERLAAARLVPAWAPPLDLIPATGWADLAHTNPDGAVPLSGWLAERVSEAIDAGQLRSGRDS